MLAIGLYKAAKTFKVITLVKSVMLMLRLVSC